MSSSADRLPRLLALVPYLLGHPGAPVAEVAEVFTISERQLRADLDLLFVCGLPGHGPGDLIDVAYEGDRIHLSNADTIARPLRLTADEALALVVALRTLADVPGLAERDALDRVLAKLETAAGQPEGDRVRVSVETTAATLATARQALAAGRRLHLTYHGASRDQTTERDVDPLRVLLVEGRSYLEGWCRLAEAVRLFRLDRVLHIAILDAPAQPPEQAHPRDLSQGLFQPSLTDVAVTIALGPSARWVADYYPCEVIEDRDRLTVALRTPDTGWVRRLALRLGPSATVMAPPELVTAVRTEAERALAAYAVTDSGTAAQKE